MIIVCQKCSSRLQIDETKLSSLAFNVRCPKCNSQVNSGSDSQNPAIAHGTTSTGGPTTSANSRFAPPKPAPLFEFDQTVSETDSPSAPAERLIELLSGLVSHRGPAFTSARPAWSSRRLLVCLPEGKREEVARSLAENGCQVFVAEDTQQAVERMRENQLDVVILDARFDAGEHGAVFVTREVNILRPAQRRRLFFVLVSPTLRSMDAHAAFINNVNAVVNASDLGDLATMMEHRMRAFNELYKDFNAVLKEHAL